ncbi:bifunctional diaminohydroxyphosphoribosylaminopyrimidine deaminase/5-amino-6-(5-phosphoribosylamino)uracil reductase RibD [Robertkochia flava]|uniref:bifunctional diaminohydroxyphosphoribosylaminopyrimidine deaminase/5-amino-6-(5-phosphoribosylamino)uracil reductase RibD n=1 Tax=Robertkochia flava TaxID=3447986 RepID=UPI001CCF5FA7|nr:bifunctional diaminohydroxyphosphoribosylaminopyrimidine deaminase/5-amino-6-(5-phosphoribosylamino)uracil reductase RibD [Robertkochia marina]
MKIHEFYIKRCLELAKNGIGNTYPNPSVGCVIVHQGEVIGEGYTSKAGGPHAEVNAINSVMNKELLKQATLYVTLEPCSHHGKTPPCADLIVESGIPRVVVGTLDSNKQVSGKGIKKLAESGCEVIAGILEAACREANKRFFCYHELKRPYIILKWAESADGYLAPLPETRVSGKPHPVWLSDQPSRQLVHKWRSEEQAILVGTSTALADNPSLTTRDWFGANPLRIFFDQSGKLPENSNLLDGSTPTIVFTANAAYYADKAIKDLEIVRMAPKIPLPELVAKTLYEKHIQSVIIEGGATTLNSFLAADLWDEARIFRTPTTFGRGIKAPEINQAATQITDSGKDQLHLYKHPGNLKDTI